MLERLRTVVCAAPDLPAATAFYTQLLGQEPYFREPYYVGFDVNSCELGLDPHAPAAPAPSGPVTYWRVPDAHAA